MVYVGFDGRDGRDGARDGRGAATSPVTFRHGESKSAGHSVTQAVTLHHGAITVTRSPLSLEEGDRDGCEPRRSRRRVASRFCKLDARMLWPWAAGGTPPTKAIW